MRFAGGRIGYMSEKRSIVVTAKRLPGTKTIVPQRIVSAIDDDPLSRTRNDDRHFLGLDGCDHCERQKPHSAVVHESSPLQLTIGLMRGADPARPPP